MNRTIKDATVKRHYYPSHDHLKSHLHTLLMAHNFAKRLKGPTPYEHICKIWIMINETLHKLLNRIHGLLFYRQDAPVPLPPWICRLPQRPTARAG